MFSRRRRIQELLLRGWQRFQRCQLCLPRLEQQSGSSQDLFLRKEEQLYQLMEARLLLSSLLIYLTSPLATFWQRHGFSCFLMARGGSLSVEQIVRPVNFHYFKRHKTGMSTTRLEMIQPMMGLPRPLVVCTVRSRL